MKYLSLLLLMCIALTSCNLGYDVEGDHVVYKYWHSGLGISTAEFEVLGAHPETFKTLEHDDYAVDKNQAYYRGKSIQGADPGSFSSILSYYAKDKYRAYQRSVTIKNADGRTFRVIDGGPYSRDSKDYYFDTLALHVSDLRSFKILNQKFDYGYWAKDKTSYYINGRKYPLADYFTFEKLTGGYARDKMQVYFDGEIVKGADPVSIKVLDFARSEDKNSKFDGAKKLNIKDPKTFVIIDNRFTKDKVNVYNADSIVIGADPASFEVVNWAWQKDKHYYYYHGKRLNGIDHNTFTLLQDNYAKDKKHVYYYDKLIQGADPATFQVDEMTYVGKDKFGCYEAGERIDCAKAGRDF